jgi:hypothetical protein
MCVKIEFFRFKKWKNHPKRGGKKEKHLSTIMDLLCAFPKKIMIIPCACNWISWGPRIKRTWPIFGTPIPMCYIWVGWEEAVYIQFSGSFLPIHITRSQQGIDLSPIFSEPVTINLECPMELIQWVEQCPKAPLPRLVAAFWRWAACLYFDTQRSGDVSGGCSCPKDCN